VGPVPRDLLTIVPDNLPALGQSAHLAIERAFVAMLLEAPELSTGIDIVAASDRDSRVGPLHAFALCTEFVPIVPAGSPGIATVAIGLVTDMDDHGETVRADWLGRITRALSGRTFYVGATAILQGWSVKSVKDESQGRKVLDVVALRVGAEV
jgi:hypothetical protein